MLEITFALNLQEDITLHILQPLEEAIAKEPDILTVELVGPAAVAPDKALLLYDALMHRSSKTHLITYGRSCLLDSAVLLWLAGDERRMRDDAWIQMDSLERLEDTQPWSKAAEPFRRLKKPVLIPPLIIDYRTVAHYLNMYLPLEEVADRPIFQGELKELGLIDSPEYTLQLKQLFQKSTRAEEGGQAEGQDLGTIASLTL